MLRLRTMTINSRLFPKEVLRRSELPLHLFQGHSFSFWDHRFHPHELKYHHHGEERENVAGRKHGDHLGEECGKQGGEDPMREAAECLTLSPMLIRKYLGDEYPDNSSLADRVSRNECEDAERNNRIVLRKESPRHQAERRDIPERSNVKKRTPPQSINEP